MVSQYRRRRLDRRWWERGYLRAGAASGDGEEFGEKIALSALSALRTQRTLREESQRNDGDVRS